MDAAVFMAQHDAAKAYSFICTLLRSTLAFEVEDLVSKLARIHEIPLDEIDEFPDHPYKVKDDE